MNTTFETEVLSCIRLLDQPSISFVDIWYMLTSVTLDLSTEDLQTLNEQVTEKIFGILKRGDFNELYHAKDVLDILEIYCEIPEYVVPFFNDCLVKIDEGNWSALGRGQPPIAEEYNLDAAREWANNFNMNLTVEQLTQLIDYRYVFMYWCEKNVKTITSYSIQELISLY